MIKKKMLLFTMIFCLLFSSVCFAGEKSRNIDVYFNSINISVDGDPVRVDNILYAGKTYAPMRAVAEMLGKKVGWNSATNTASIDDTDTPQAVSKDSGSGIARKASISVVFNKVKLSVSGSPVKVDNFLYAGTTYVPMRAVAEMLGRKVGWNNNTKTASIYDERSEQAELAEKNQLSMVYTLRKNVKVGYNFNYELLNIAAAHSADFKHKGYVGDNNTINKLVKDYFSQLAKRNYSDDLSKQSMDGIINRFIKGESNATLAYDKSLTEKIWLLKFRGTFTQSGNIKNVDELLIALKDFKGYSKFDEFIARNQKAYQDVLDEFKKTVNFDYIANLQEFLGLNMDKSLFYIILSPSENGGSAIVLYDANELPVYFITMNPIRSPERILHLIYHETIHNYLNPILAKDSTKYRNENFTGVLNKNAGASNAFNETVTRGLTYLILNRYHNIDTSSLMADEIQKGWINTDKIYELLKNEYVGNRGNYKYIEEFLPRILEYLNKLN